MQPHPPPSRPRRSVGPNDTLTVAVIGTNGRGLAHIECLTDMPGVEIAYICDVDDRAIATGIKAATKRQKAEPKGLKDFRKALEDKSLDAVTIATPDHWHAPMAILALAAGKHVYLEKPCSHNPYEGELLIEAVRKHQARAADGQPAALVSQHPAGDHGKSMTGSSAGPISAAPGMTTARASIGHGKAAPVPGWLDYELWQGPAPRRPYRDNLIHYNWHWFWHWGTGEALNNGTHEVDVCRWALGVDWPIRVASTGGRYQFEDDWETPDTQVIGWDFAERKSIAWEGRSCNQIPSRGPGPRRDGLWHRRRRPAGRQQLHHLRQEQEGGQGGQGEGGRGPDEHPQRHRDGAWTSCTSRISSRPSAPAQRLNSPIEEGHKSVTMLHLGNIAWRVGRELHCDPANGHIQKDAAGHEAVAAGV